MSRRCLPWLGLAVVLAATALAYWPGTHGGFMFDDYPNIVENPALKIHRLTPGAMMRAALSMPSVGTLDRPIAMASFALNDYFNGMYARPMKIVNLAIHLLNGVLVFLLLRLLLREYARLKDGALLLPRRRFTGRSDGPRRDHMQADASHRGGDRRSYPLSITVSENMTALAVAAAWLLAPINLTAVLYTVQRMTSLAATFTLLALIVFIVGRKWLFEHRRRFGAVVLLLLAALVLTPLSVLTKESGALTLLYALVIEWVFFRFHNGMQETGKESPSRSPFPPASARGRESSPSPLTGEGWGEGEEQPMQRKWLLPLTLTLSRASPRPSPLRGEGEDGRGNMKFAPSSGIKETRGTVAWTSIAYFAVFLLLPLVLGLAWLLPGVLSPQAWAARDFTFGERLLTEGRVIWHYLYWTLVPNIHAMTLYHDAFPISRGLFSPWTTLPAWAGITALAGAGFACARRRPLIAFGILWFLTGQALTASIFPLELVFEHREYLPSLGLFFAVFGILLLARPRERLRAARITAVIAIIVLCGAGLALRSLNWSNPLIHTAIDARTHPDSPRATYAFGRALLIIARNNPKFAPAARKALETANRVPGQSIIALSGLVLLAHDQGEPMRLDWFRAMADRLHAQPPNTQDISALNALGHCATREKNPCVFPSGAMITVFAAALRHPAPNHYVMAIYGNYLLNALGQPKAAAGIFRALLKHNPGSPGYHFSLGVCLAASGDAAGARRELAALRRLNRLGMSNPDIRKLDQLINRLYPPADSSKP